MKYLIAFIFLAVANGQILGACPSLQTRIADRCGVCSSRNDPHITTFDQIYYDQHLESCYKYVTDCPNSNVKLPFEVCGCHYPCSGQGGCPSNIMCIGDVSITFYQGNTLSRIVNIDYLNAVVATWDEYNFPVPAPPIFNIHHVSGVSYTFDTIGGHDYLYVYDVVANTHEFEIRSGVGSNDVFYGYIKYRPGNLEIHLNQGYFSTNTCGLCGYFDVDDTNEFLGSDNIDYIDPALVSPAIITPADVIKVNNFANTYLCDNATEPVDPNCQPGANAAVCFKIATACCQTLWQQTLTTTKWINPIIDVDEFQKTWLIGCARDACGLTKDDVADTCDLTGNEFSYSKDVLIDTATETYVLSIDEPRCDCLEYFDGCNWCTCDPTTGLSTCTKKQCNPWGEYQCFDDNCTAKICAHGDDKIQLDVSYDSGSTWNLNVASEVHWQNTLQASISPIDSNTILRFTVSDGGVIGGFLCTIQLCGNNGYIFEFYTDRPNTYFDVTSDSNNDELIDVFYPFGTGPWAGNVNKDKVQCMNEKADWIWNNHVGNTMVFEVNFIHHLDILEKLDCIPSPTPEPVDCCNHFNGVEQYLNECGYCQGTPAPTIECCNYYDGCNHCWCKGPNGNLPAENGPYCTKKQCDVYTEFECLDGGATRMPTSSPTIDCCNYYDGCNWCYCNGPNGQTVCTVRHCDPWGEFECLDDGATRSPTPISGIGTITDKITSISGANTVGINKINNNDNTGFDFELIKEMNEIKYLVYGTWIILFIGFSVILLTKIARCCQLKTQTFKQINDANQDI